MTHKYTGFWACLDTLKDKQQLDDLYMQGQAAWEVWKNGPAESDKKRSVLVAVPDSPVPRSTGVQV